MDAYHANLLDLAGASRGLAGTLQAAHTSHPAVVYAVAGPAAAASWIVDLPAGDLSSKLATAIFVPTSHCRLRIMPLVSAADWAHTPRATLEDLVRADQAAVEAASGDGFDRPYFSVPRQVVWISGGTTEIKVALHVTEVLSDAPAGANRNLSYGQMPRPPHAAHQTAPPIIYTAIVVIMRMRNEQSRLGSTSAQSHGFESALMCEFLGLVIIVELVNELDGPALQGSLDAWRRYVRTVAAESYRATRHFVACGGLGGHFAHDAASWFLEQMPAPEEGEFDVLLRTAERAIRWVEMLFELDHSGHPSRPAVEYRSLDKGARSAFEPVARDLL